MIYRKKKIAWTCIAKKLILRRFFLKLSIIGGPPPPPPVGILTHYDFLKGLDLESYPKKVCIKILIISQVMDPKKMYFFPL